MADRHLVEPRNALGEITQVVQIEVVAAVEPQPRAARLLGRRHVGCYGPLAVGRILRGIGLGVELHTVGAALGGSGHHGGIGIDEDRHADAALAEPRHDVAQERAVADRVPSGVRGNGVGRVGHQRNLRRHHFAHQVGERRNGVALDIEFGGEHALERAHVVVADMTRIGARMHRDPLSAEALDVRGRAHHVGEVASARIAYHGNLIDINT